MPFLMGTGVGLRPKPPYAQDLSASATASGALGKGLALAVAAFAALCTASATSAKTTRKVLAATCTGTVTRAQAVAHTLAAAVSGAPVLARAVVHALAATCTGTISLARSTAHTLASTLTATISVVHVAAHALAATCTGTVSRAQDVTHAASSTITGTVTRTQAITHTASATITATVALLRAVTHLLAASCTGTATRASALARAMAATCAGTVSHVRGTIAARTATLLPSAPAVAGPDTRSDTFARADQSGWGTASDGHTWTAFGGFDTESVSGGRGVQTAGAGGATDGVLLGAALGSDVEVLVRWALPSASDIDDTFADILLRTSADGATTVAVFIANGSTGLFFNGTLATFAPSLSLAVGTPVWTRVRAVGPHYQARTWLDGTSEPGAWDLDTVNTTATSELHVGLSSNLITAGDQIAFDSFSATALVPQFPRATQHTMATLLTQTAARTHAAAHAAAATLTQTAAVAKSLILALTAFTASLTGVPSLARAAAHGLSSTLTGAGARTSALARALAATLTSTGTRAASAGRTLTASCTGTAARTQDVAHRAAAMLTATPALTRRTAAALSALLTGAGSLAGTLLGAAGGVVQTLAASLALAGTPALARRTASGVAAALTGTGALARGARHALAATITGTRYRQTRAISSRRAATLRPAPALHRALALGRPVFTALLGASAAARRGARKALSAQEAASAGLGPRAIAKALRAPLRLRAPLLRALTRSLAALIPARAALGRSWAYAVGAAALAPASALMRVTARSLAAGVTAVGQRGARGITSARTSALAAGGRVTRAVAYALPDALLDALGALASRHWLLRRAARRALVRVHVGRAHLFVPGAVRMVSLFFARPTLFVPLPATRHRGALVPAGGSQRRASLYVLPSRMHTFVTQATGVSSVIFVPAPGQLGSPQLAPREQNISFTFDFTSDLPPLTAIVDFETIVTQGSDPTDISERFVGGSNLSTPKVTLALGDGTQEKGEEYYITLLVTLDNDPASVLAGTLSLPVKK